MGLKGGQDELSEMELAELQTVRKMISVSETNYNETYRHVRELVLRGNAACEAFRAREHAIKVMESDKKESVNDFQAFR